MKFSVMTSVALAVMSAFPAPSAAQSVLRYSAMTEPPSLDPVFSIMPSAQHHGHLIYDTLFGRACDGSPKPQMVGEYSVEPGQSGAVWTMSLRPGLEFHDGSPVESDDVVASLDRWRQKDQLGMKLSSVGMELSAVDSDTFTITMPFETEMLLFALAKPRAVGAYIMRAEDAATPISQPALSNIGSGPYRFVHDEYVKGHKMVYEKNDRYVPRDEPTDCLAGAKIVELDRVEWMVMPDHSTAVSALLNDELDMFESTPLDLLPLLVDDPTIDLVTLNKLGRMAYIRFNFTQHPFADSDARRAVIKLLSQMDVLSVIGGNNPEYMQACYSYLGCGAANEDSAGNEWMAELDVEGAHQLLADAGYANEPIVLFAPADDEAGHRAGTYVAEALRAGGLNIDLRLVDYGTMIAETMKPDTWHMFIASDPALDLNNPLTNIGLADSCDSATGSPGWSCSPELIQLKDEYLRADTTEQREIILSAIAAEASELMPRALLGQYRQPAIIRQGFEGLVPAEILVFWNVTKSQ